MKEIEEKIEEDGSCPYIKRKGRDGRARGNVGNLGGMEIGVIRRVGYWGWMSKRKGKQGLIRDNT